MNPEMMQKIGLADGCSPQDKMAKFAAYAMGDASPEEMKAMADDLDQAEDPAAKAMAAKMRKFVRWGEELTCPKCGSDHIGSEPARSGGFKLTCKSCGRTWEEDQYGYSKMQAPTEEEKAEAGKLATLARTLGVPASIDAIAAAVVPMSQFSALQVRLSALESERAAEKQAAADAKVKDLVDQAIAGGYPADQRDALTKFARADFAGASALVARNLKETASLYTRTAVGRLGEARGSVPAGADVVERGSVVSFGRNLADAIKAHQKAHPGMSYEDAASAVAAAKPELVQSYHSFSR